MKSLPYLCLSTSQCEQDQELLTAGKNPDLTKTQAMGKIWLLAAWTKSLIIEESALGSALVYGITFAMSLLTCCSACESFLDWSRRIKCQDIQWQKIRSGLRSCLVRIRSRKSAGFVLVKLLRTLCWGAFWHSTSFGILCQAKKMMNPNSWNGETILAAAGASCL